MGTAWARQRRGVDALSRKKKTPDDRFINGDEGGGNQLVGTQQQEGEGRKHARDVLLS